MHFKLFINATSEKYNVHKTLTPFLKINWILCTQLRRWLITEHLFNHIRISEGKKRNVEIQVKPFII